MARELIDFSNFYGEAVVGDLDPIHEVAIWCQSCDHVRMAPVITVQSAFASDTRLDSIATAYKCTSCGQPTTFVDMRRALHWIG